MPQTRVRPFDLKELIDTYGDINLSDAITALQQEAQVSFDCPKCVDKNVQQNPPATGKLTVTAANSETVEIICDLCQGYLKTSQEYIEDPVGVFTPQIVQP
jgi:transcription elongation factor Elf1